MLNFQEYQKLFLGDRRNCDRFTRHGSCGRLAPYARQIPEVALELGYYQAFWNSSPVIQQLPEVMNKIHEYELQLYQQLIDKANQALVRLEVEFINNSTIKAMFLWVNAEELTLLERVTLAWTVLQEVEEQLAAVREVNSALLLALSSSHCLSVFPLGSGSYTRKSLDSGVGHRTFRLVPSC